MFEKGSASVPPHRKRKFGSYLIGHSVCCIQTGVSKKHNLLQYAKTSSSLLREARNAVFCFSFLKKEILLHSDKAAGVAASMPFFCVAALVCKLAITPHFCPDLTPCVAPAFSLKGS